MKKVIGILLAAVLTVGAVLPVFAETPTEIPTEASPLPGAEASEPSVSPAPSETAVLRIDTSHQYEGMNSAYETGYIPAVKDGEAHIFLPLVSTLPLQGEQITVSLDLGPAGCEAFVAANYEKSFSLTELTPLGGSTPEQIFPVAFSLSLAEDRLNGVYPVTAHVRAADKAGTAVSLDYTVFVTVSDGKSRIPPAPPEPEKPTAEPVVYLSDSVLEPEVIQAGEPFTWTLTLKNSLTTKSVKNLLMTVELGEEKVDLLEKSNVIPVDTIGAGEEKTVTLHMQAEPAIPEGKHRLNLSFRYDSSTALGLSAVGTHVFTVRQPAKLSYDGASLPAKVFGDDTVTIPVNLMNTGKAPLYNCRIDYDIPGLQSGGTVFVGELAPGENKTGNGNLLADSQKLGPTQGTLTITYEDAYGEVYTQTAEVSTQIEKRPEPQEEESSEEKKPSLWWLYTIAGLVLGGGLGFGIPWFIRDRKQRKQDDLRL